MAENSEKKLKNQLWEGKGSQKDQRKKKSESQVLTLEMHKIMGDT